MKPKLNILLDVDGPVVDMYPEWYKLHNNNCMVCKKPLLVEDVTEWGVHKFVECGTDIYNYLYDETLYDHALPQDGALDGVSTLRKLGHRVIFVTAGLQPAKIKWLRDWGLIDPTLWRSDENWAIMNDKNLINGDVLIDDHIGNLNKFKGFPIIFDQIHNRGEDQFLRVYNWKNIIDFIKGAY